MSCVFPGTRLFVFSSFLVVWVLRMASGVDVQVVSGSVSLKMLCVFSGVYHGFLVLCGWFFGEFLMGSFVFKDLWSCYFQK